MLGCDVTLDAVKKTDLQVLRDSEGEGQRPAGLSSKIEHGNFNDKNWYINRWFSIHSCVNLN